MNVKIWPRSKFNVLFAVFALLAVMALVAGALSTQSIENILQSTSFQDYQGLVGFTGEYALSDDDSLASVIVLFETEPAAVQIYEAEVEGRSLLESTAERAVEDEHTLFEQELTQLFSDSSLEVESNRSSESASEPYEILWKYRIALNGVNMLLPSNMVEKVANFESVQAIYPDIAIEIDPLPEPELFDAASIESFSAGIPPAGMRPGRATMRADDLHALGYRGEGVLIAMLDTGIYYNHPAFKGAFPTIAEMQARGVDLGNGDGINIDGTYYYIGKNFFTGTDELPQNDPNEVAPGPLLNSLPPRSTGTEHGTLVAGVMVGRNAGTIPAISGIAPEAEIITYRILESTAGSASTGGAIAAKERAVINRADVINMSFGGSSGAFVTLADLALNNLALANPNVIFVASAGNASEEYFSTSINASKAISVASVNVGAASASGNFNHQDPRTWLMSTWSSRGPVEISCEIKPDVGVHGHSVLSAVPPWGNRGNNSNGYLGTSGTSMAAPHIAGAAALLVDYSRQNASEQWTAEEIKVRLMNNAYSFGEDRSEDIGVFHTGAGYVDVYAAAKADTTVSVTYDRVLYGAIRAPFSSQTYTTTETGSISFNNIGGNYSAFSLLADPSPNVRTLPITIANTSEELRTYTIDYVFANNPNGAMALTFCQRRVEVDSGHTAEFSATASVRGSIPAWIDEGFYEGHVHVKDGDTLVARLPFALVNESAVQVPASELNFNLGEGQTVPANIDSINVLHGINILDFLESYHRGFPAGNPTKEGYIFEGWYLDADLTDSLTADTTMSTADTVLHAKWSQGEIQMSAGLEYSLVVHTDGTLWSWGRNNFGQLGLGDTDNRDIPTLVPDTGISGSRWIDVVAGVSHSIGLRDDGTLWSWGANSIGQLGTGSTSAAPVLVPTQVSTTGVTGDKWIAVSLGQHHSVALRCDGTLWSWGTNADGRLGVSSVFTWQSVSVPTRISTPNVGDGWKMVAAGDSHTLAICNSGTLWAWGTNGQGQLGLGYFAPFSHRLVPTEVPIVGISGTEWEYITAGHNYTLAIRCDGTLWSWGLNTSGQLGLGDTSLRSAPTLVPATNVSGDRWASVTAGTSVASHIHHALALRDDGTLWAWGSNANSSTLGIWSSSLWTSHQVTVPTEVCVPSVSGSTWITASAGGGHTLVLCADNLVWSFGNNRLGQLGLGDLANRITPTEVLFSENSREPLSPSDNMQISAGLNHSLAVHTDGTLWAWGANNWGQLGLGDTNRRDTPALVPDEEISGSRWISVAAGTSHSVGLRDDGTLWGWGLGQIGLRTSTSALFTPTPTEMLRVGANSKWIQVSAGSNYILAIRCDGTLWAWGSGVNGRLGMGDDVRRNFPTKVSVPDVNNGWKMVAAAGGQFQGSGDAHVLAICNDGTLWAWGNNTAGQLGLDDTVQRLAPTEVSTVGISGDEWIYVTVGRHYTLAIRCDGTLWSFGINANGQLGLGDTAFRTTPILVPTANVSGNRWVSVTAGASYMQGGNQTLALRDDGTLWAWGNGANGRLGCGNTSVRILPTRVQPTLNGTSTWIAVSAGGGHTLALCTDNILWSFGLGSSGQLGLGDTIQRLAPNKVLMPDVDTGGQDTDPLDPSDEMQISAGQNHSLAVCTEGILWTWGQNTSGQLGLGNTDSRDTPAQVPDAGISGNGWISAAAGNSHSIALRDDGTLWAWGINNVGQLGTGSSSSAPVLMPTKVSTAGVTGNRWLAVFAGHNHNVAVRCDGTLWALGNVHAKLGANSDGWKIVAAGNGHTLAICSNGTLWAWGSNNSGQLGFGDTTSRSLPTEVPAAGISGDVWTYVTAARDYTLAIRCDGTLWAWGANLSGQLGLGDTARRLEPTLVSAANVSGDKWLSVTAGTNINMGNDDHTLALRDDGTLWAWGNGANGKLGDGTIFGGRSPAKVQSVGNNISTWITASAGGSHTLALCTDNALWSFGYNASGQLGTGDAIRRIFPDAVLTLGVINTGGQDTSIFDPSDDIQVSTGTSHSLAICTDGTLWTWGQNASGQLGLGDTNNRNVPVEVPDGGMSGTEWISIAAGNSYSVGLRDDGTLWSWGINALGQLGLGNTSTTPTLVPTEVLTTDVTGNRWLAISVGSDHVLALRCDGTLWSWGSNVNGRLGVGDTVSRNRPTRVSIASNGGWSVLAAGGAHSLALCSNGTLWGWGQGGHGALGAGNAVDQRLPIPISVAGVSGDVWTYASAGSMHTLALRCDGTLWAFGVNSSGQLGIGTFSNQSAVPTLVLTANVTGDRWISVSASGHNLALRDDGTLWSWGFASNGRLGDGTISTRNSPVQVQPTGNNVDTWIAASAGGTQSLALCTDGDLWAWGLNSSGQLGVGDTAQRLVPTEVVRSLP